MHSVKAVSSIATVELGNDIRASLERRAAAVCTRIEELCRGSGPASFELQDKYLKAVSDIQKVSICHLPESQGSFSVADGCLVIKEEAVAKLLNAVTEDLSRKPGTSGAHLASDQIPDLMESVLTTYMLHELRHRTQGVGNYSVVQSLGKAVGKMAMAELDMTADRDAAYAKAVLADPDADRTEFLLNFREALFLSHAYFFKVFPVEGARPDKVARAIAVMLMIARLAGLDPLLPTSEQTDFPLDVPLVVQVSISGRQLAVFQAEPARKLLFVANDEEGVGALIQAIDEGDMDDALRRAFALWALKLKNL